MGSRGALAFAVLMVATLIYLAQDAGAQPSAPSTHVTTVLPVGDSICRSTADAAWRGIPNTRTVGAGRTNQPTDHLVDHNCNTSWRAATMSGEEPKARRICIAVSRACHTALEATKQFMPDLTFVMIGVNDKVIGRSDEDVENSLRILLRQITDANPFGRFIVASEPSGDGRTDGYNARLPRVVSDFRAKGHDVWFVDVAARMSPDDYGVADKVHPTNAGRRKLAGIIRGFVTPLTQAKDVHCGCVQGAAQTSGTQSLDSLARARYPRHPSLTAVNVRSALALNNRIDRARLRGKAYDRQAAGAGWNLPPGTWVYYPARLRVWVV